MVGGMDIEQGGLTAEQGEKSQSGYSFLQIIIGALMLWQGLKNQPYSDTCPNGAAEYLYIAGILLLVLNLMGLIGVIAQKCAMKDGKVTCGEQCGLNFLSFITGMMWLGDLGLAIWGSVVVFGAYSTWTYDLKAAAKDDTYCDYTCFMFAFVLLILRWLIMPFAICCGCMKLMCKGCPKGAQAS